MRRRMPSLASFHRGSRVYPGRQLMAAGWGYTSLENKVLPTELQKVKKNILIQHIGGAK